MADNINPKAGVQRTGAFSSENSYLAWSSMHMDGRSTTDKRGRAEKERAAQETESMFEKMGQTINKSSNADLDIWQSINPGTWYGTNPQQAIQAMQGLKAGEEIIAFDFETLGTFFGDTSKGQADFGTITEMAFGRYKLNDQLIPEHTGKTILNEGGRRTFAPSEYGKNALSVLVKPGEHAEAKIDHLLKRASSMGRQWTGFTQDEYRTLNDLILYSDSKNLKNMHGMTFIMGQNRQAQALDGSMFKQEHIQAMKRGFRNLKGQGTNAENLALGLNKFFYESGSGIKKMAGFNTQNFDVPIFKEFLANHIMPQLSGSATATQAVSRMMKDLQNVQNVDLYQAISVVNKNLHDTVGSSGKQHNIARNLGIQFQDAHFGLDDLQLTMDIWSKMGTNFQSNIHNSKGVNPHRTASWNSNPIQKGMELFSVSGISSDSASPIDMVYRKTKNGFKPAYGGSFRPNPISKNTHYTVEKMIKGLEHDGKKYDGVMLHNQDDDLFHFIANEDSHKLRNTFQQHFVAADSLSMQDRLDGKNFTQLDRTRRGWDKMFESGGVDMMDRMLSGLDALQEGRARWGGKKGGDKQIAHYVKSAMSQQYGNNNPFKGSDKMFKDLVVMEDRLKEEAPYMKEFINEVRLNKDISGNRHLQGVAANAFRQQMDDYFGENREGVSRGSHVPVLGGIKIPGVNDEMSINLRNQSTIERSISSMMSKGVGGGKHHGVTQTRLKALLNELKSKGVFDETTKQRDKLKAYESMIKNIGNSTSAQEQAYMIYRNLSADIEEAHRIQKISGITNTIDVENPTKMIDSRREKIASRWQSVKNEIITSSIQQAKLFSTRTWEGGAVNTVGTPIVDIARNHDQHMQKMMDITGLSNTNRTTIQSNQALGTLSRLANAYKTGDTEVAFIASEMSDKYKTLHMVVANKNDAERIFKLRPNEILQDSKAFAIPIPMLNGDGELIMPGSNGRPSIKHAQLTAIQIKDGVGFGTGMDVAVQRAINMSGYAKDLFKSGNMNKASSVISMQMKDSVNNLSARNIEEDIRGSDSKARKWSISGMINVQGYAEEWYGYQYAGTPGKDVATIKDRMEKNKGQSFFESMNSKEQLSFQRGIDQYMQNIYGIRTHSHSAKGEYVSKGVRSTRDIRALTPMGYLNPMARENIMKSINYKAMDTELIRERLRANGSSEAEIERYLSRGIVTDVASDVLESGGKTAYLNVRSANMHSKQLSSIIGDNVELQNILKEANIDPARLSTYDGNFIMRESLANVFEVKREGKVKIEEKQFLDQRIASLFEGMKPNADGVIKLSQPVDLLGHLGGTNLEQNPTGYTGHKDAHRITVGWMMVDEIAKDAATISNPSKNIHITGFDQKSNQLLYETIDKTVSGTKFLTDVGDRITAGIFLPDRAMDIIAPGADVILEENKPDRHQIGSEMYKSTALVVDEAKRKAATVGGLKGTEVLETLDDLMRSHFRIGKEDLDSLRLQNGQFVLSNVFGIDNKIGFGQMGQFLAEASDKLGIDSEVLGISYTKNGNGTYNVGDSKSGLAYGQIGLGVSNTYNWEKSMASVDGFGDGLVNWGIKERDVILNKANLSLQGANEGQRAVVKNWLDSHMDQAIEAQNGGIHSGGIKGYKQGVSAASRYMRSNEISNNMPVIRTEGNNFEGSRVVDGRVELSMNALEDMPHFKNKQAKTVQDYQRTLIQAGEADVQFGKALKENNGVFMFELPEALHDKYGKSHVAMLDTRLAAIPGTEKAMLNDIQQTQGSIWSKLKEYQNISPDSTAVEIDRVTRGLDRAIGAQEEVINKALVYSKEGGMAKTGMTAKMDMAGQFRIQGINPLENKTYKEGTAYVSESRLFEMIGGKEAHVMENIMGYSSKELQGMSIKDQRAKIVDYTQTEGLYGFTNRYPTIDSDTIQSLRVQVDKSLRKDDRGAYLTVGTATKMKADYDGDFLSIVMAQYKEKTFAKDMHDAMATMNAVDTERFVDVGQQVMQGLSKEANGRGVTVGSLMADGTFMNMYNEEVVARVRQIDDMETLQSRMGKSYVGSFDNTRHKLIQLAKDTYSIVEENQSQLNGMFGSTPEEVSDNLKTKRAQVAEFGRVLSQDTISAKKWSIAGTQEQLMREADETTQAHWKANGADFEQATMMKMQERVVALEVMQDGLRKMGPQGLKDIHDANRVLGLFKTDEQFDADVQASRNHAQYPARTEEGLVGQKFKLSEMLDTVEELFRGNRGNAWMQNTSLLAGVSKGADPEATSKLMGLNMRDELIMTDVMQDLVDNGTFADDGMSSRLNNLRQARAENVVARFNQSNNFNDEGPIRPQQVSDGLLSGHTMASRAGTGLSDLSSQFLGNIGTGKMGAVAGWGAAVFGGMWATSALMRSGPTPEGTTAQEMTEMQSVPTKNMMGSPTARITQQSENINIQINAKDAKGMGTDQVTALVQQELGAMMNMDMNMNVNVSDNSQELDQEWIQNVVARSINGFAF